jgi:hypothetical protein
MQFIFGWISFPVPLYVRWIAERSVDWGKTVEGVFGRRRKMQQRWWGENYAIKCSTISLHHRIFLGWINKTSVYKHFTYFPIYDWPSLLLHWKRNRLLFGKPLLVADKRTAVKSHLKVKPVSTKSLFLIWGAQCAYHYFLAGFTCVVLFREMVSKNLWNFIRIVGGVFDKIAILFCFPFEGFYFSSWYVHVYRTDLWRIDSWVMNLNKIIHPFRR